VWTKPSKCYGGHPDCDHAAKNGDTIKIAAGISLGSLDGQDFNSLRTPEVGSISTWAGVEDAIPERRPERCGEFESVCLRDMACVSVDNGASDNHGALILVAEPASSL
jgi:hypothetical protein